MSTFTLPHIDSNALSIARSHRSMLERFVVLSLLLHVLAVLLFGDVGGNSEAGGQRRGAQLWGGMFPGIPPASSITVAPRIAMRN